MPQIFQVLRCYKCLVFQIHQMKKSSKFECKLCGEKQSIKRHYGIGTAKDCRLHVQKLNGIRKEIDELTELNQSSSLEENECINIKEELNVEVPPSKKSKWSDFVDNKEEENQLNADTNTMYLNNTEVVLEIPKKRKTNFNCPRLKTSTKTVKKYNFTENTLREVSPIMTNENKEVSKCVKNSKCFVKSLNLHDTSFKKEPETEVNVKKIALPTQALNVKEEVKPCYVPTTVSSNSKWAQFVEECSEGEIFEEDEHADLIGENESQKYGEPVSSKELFALCDDDDLDNLLDI